MRNRPGSTSKNIPAEAGQIGELALTISIEHDGETCLTHVSIWLSPSELTDDNKAEYRARDVDRVHVPTSARLPAVTATVYLVMVFLSIPNILLNFFPLRLGS